MEQENIQQDTPQQPKEHASLEEAIFGSNDEGSNDLSDVFTTGKEEVKTEAPTTGQPEVDTEVKQETTQDNDTTRYQYWQSQADKMKQENQRLQAAMQQQQQMQEQMYHQQMMEQQANMVSNTPNDIMEKIKDVPGRLIIKEYPTASAHSGHFKSLINEFIQFNFGVPVL